MFILADHSQSAQRDGALRYSIAIEASPKSARYYYYN